MTGALWYSHGAVTWASLAQLTGPRAVELSLALSLLGSSIPWLVVYILDTEESWCSHIHTYKEAILLMIAEAVQEGVYTLVSQAIMPSSQWSHGFTEVPYQREREYHHVICMHRMLSIELMVFRLSTFCSITLITHTQWLLGTIKMQMLIVQGRHLATIIYHKSLIQQAN